MAKKPAQAQSTGPKKHTITVIGGGSSAASIVRYIGYEISENRDLLPLEVEIIEAGDKLGLGPAWDKDNLRPWHLVNSYSDQEDIAKEREWYKIYADRFAGTLEGCNSQRGEITRASYGVMTQLSMENEMEYLRRLGVDLKITTNTTVKDVKETKDGYTVITEQGEKKHSDFVVLATGHWQHKKPAHSNPGIYESPWPASKIEEIDSNQPIAVMGTSLSAIDGALTLAHKAGTFSKKDGKLVYTPKPGAENFKIDMYSPHGVLPMVLGDLSGKGPAIDDVIIPQQPDGRIALSDVYDSFRDNFLRTVAKHRPIPSYLAPIDRALRESPDIETAVAKFYKAMARIPAQERLERQVDGVSNSLDMEEPIFWQRYIRQTSSTLELMSNAMHGEDRKYFTDEVRPIFTKLAYGMMLSNAEQMLAVMQSGHLEVHALGKEYSMGTAHEGKKKLPGAEIRYTDSEGVAQEKYYKAVVKATGDDPYRLKDATPLMKNLFKSGMVQALATPYKDQKLGETQFELEQDDPGAVRRTILKDGKYCHSGGGVYINPDYILQSDPDKKAKPLHDHFYAMGPLITNHFPLLHGFKPIRDAGERICENISDAIMVARHREVTSHKPAGLLATFEHPNMPITLAVARANTPPEALEQIRKYVAYTMGLPEEFIGATSIDKLPPQYQQMVADAQASER